MSLRQAPYVFIASLTAAFLCSCAAHHSVRPQPAPAAPVASHGPAEALPQTKPAPKPAFDSGPFLQEASEDISKGMYGEALDTYKEALSDHPGNRKLLLAYENALLEMKKTACVKFEKKDYAAAGLLYSLVSRNYLTRPSPAEAGYLKDRIKDCTATLTEMGLVSYRKGDLAGAISVWQDILKFDPENAEIIKALETARVQLKNLSK